MLSILFQSLKSVQKKEGKILDSITVLLNCDKKETIKKDKFDCSTNALSYIYSDFYTGWIWCRSDFFCNNFIDLYDFFSVESFVFRSLLILSLLPL